MGKRILVFFASEIEVPERDIESRLKGSIGRQELEVKEKWELARYN
jgi:hypothetical protein